MPSINDLKSFIAMNLITNNPVSIGDINIAEEINRPKINMIKDKTRRMKYQQNYRRQNRLTRGTECSYKKNNINN